MSRLARLFAGLLMVSSLSGCCLFGHGGGGYAPYGGGGGACGPCGAASAGGYPSAMYAPGMQQAAFAQPQIGGYPVVAAAPPQDVLGTC